MQMIELAEKDISVYLCNFNLHILNANISIKFPCHYFLQWKSINGKVLAYSKKYPSQNSSSVEFNQSLNLNTQMLYDNSTKQFYKKETLLTINLVSKSRPDQVKLVGRVNIDLSQIANNSVSLYSEFAPYKLTYCSVNADITFKAQITGRQLTNKQPNNLDKSSFNDFFVFNSSGTPSQQMTKITPKQVSNIQNTTFPTMKAKQTKTNIQSAKIIQKQDKTFPQEMQTVINYQSSNILKNEDTSFRTVPHKKQVTFKSTLNDSLEHNNLWTLRDNNFSDQIDLNKRKINDLQRKISDLCKNLQQSKTQAQRKDSQNRQKQELIQRLTQNEYKMRQQFESLKKMKISSSSNQNAVFESQQIEMPKNQYLRSAKQTQRRSNGFEQLYNQKISHALQSQRMLQQNQYIIRELQALRSQLQKKLSNQKSQTQQLQYIWKQKRDHYEQKIRSLQKQRRQNQFELQGLIKYKSRVQQVTQQKNRIRMQYKQLQHELMKSRFELNDKIQKNAQSQQRLQTKQIQNDKLKQQNKQLMNIKINNQKQLTQLLIQNEKISSLNKIKQDQILKLSNKLQQQYKRLNRLQNEMVNNKKVQQQKYRMQQKLNQYNSYMQTLQSTIKTLQNQIQACQYISKINQNLKQQITKLQSKILQQKQQIQIKNNKIIQKQQEINNITKLKQQQLTKLNNQINNIQQQKQLLLQKNISFNTQIQNIQNILKQSFHKQNIQNNQYINKLKQQLKISNQQYQNILKHKNTLQQQIQSIIQQKQQTISKLQKNIIGLQLRIQDLLNTINDKNQLIQLKDIQLQNRKSLTQSLTNKLQQMQSKQLQMHQTINILQTQSKKIFDIIQQKQLIDQQINQLRYNTQHHLQIIQQLQDNILQYKIQKQQLIRKYQEQLQINQLQHNNKYKQNHYYQSQNISHKLSYQQQQLHLQQLTHKIKSIYQQLQSKNQFIKSLQYQNDNLLKQQIYLETILNQSPSQPSIQEQQLYNQNNDFNQQANKQRQMELRLHQQQNLHKFVNQISQLSQKIIELQAIINQQQQGQIYQPQYTNRIMIQQNQKPYHIDQKSQQITPVKHTLTDDLPIQSADNNFILSDRKYPISNRSNQSLGSFQYVQNYANKQSQNLSIIPSLQLYNSKTKQMQNISLNNYRNNLPSDERITQKKDIISSKHNSQLLTFQHKQRFNLKIQQQFSQIIKPLENKKQQIKLIKSSISQLIELQRLGIYLSTQQRDNPQLKIQKLISLTNNKNFIIKDLQTKCLNLARAIHQLQNKCEDSNKIINQLQKSLFQKRQNARTGKIRLNSPRKIQSPLFQQNNSNKKRSRSPSPTSKIAKNDSLSEKQFIKMKNTIQTQSSDIKRLKKNLRLMNLELATLRNLKKEKVIGGTMIKINKSFSQSHIHDGENLTLLEDTNYFNMTNAANANQKSYIIRRNLNEQESMYDMRKSPKKASAYGQIISNRQFLQKKFNINSRINYPSRLFTQSNAENKQNLSLQRRIMEKLENTAHFSALQQQNTQFVTTINDLRHKISQLQQTLIVIEQQKVFLQNQLQIFEQQKFCASSDLNARQIQIYELYKTIIGLREEISMLKYQNESYLKMIEDHEANVNSIVRKAEQNCSKIKDRSKQNEKIGSISVSNIQYLNQEPKSQISYDYIMKQSIRQSLQQGRQLIRQQQRVSMIQKIQRYEKKIQQSMFIQKQKQILQQQIQSKQQIMIDQNERLYEQQSIIKQLKSKINSLQQQMNRLNDMLIKKDYQFSNFIINNNNNSNNINNSNNNSNNNKSNIISNIQGQILGQQSNQQSKYKQSKQQKQKQLISVQKQKQKQKQLISVQKQKQTKQIQNLSIILYQNQSLIKQNINLKQQVQYLGNQIDRINLQFNKLNNLLYQRQDQITQLKLSIQSIINQNKHNQLQYQQVIKQLQSQIHQMKLKHNQFEQRQTQPNTLLPTKNKLVGYQNNNNVQQQQKPSGILIQFLYNRIKDLYEQFKNLKINIYNLSIRVQNQSEQYKLNQQRKQFLIALLQSMENNINTTFNVITQVNT